MKQRVHIQEKMRITKCHSQEKMLFEWRLWLKDGTREIRELGSSETVLHSQLQGLKFMNGLEMLEDMFSCSSRFDIDFTIHA